MKLKEIKEEMKVKVKETVDSSFAGEIGEVTYIDIEDDENNISIELYFEQFEEIYYCPYDRFKPEELEKAQ